MYSTSKSVAQVRPSKKYGVDSFISFIEAKNPEDIKPKPYAYLKVVDASGVRDLGISTTFMPNRSIYLGGSLIMKIKEEENSLQIFDLEKNEAASDSIYIHG